MPSADTATPPDHRDVHDDDEDDARRPDEVDDQVPLRDDPPDVLSAAGGTESIRDEGPCFVDMP